MTPPIPAGRFAWHELRTSAAEAAKKFYPTFMGWTTAPFAGEDYTMWMQGALPAAG